MSAGEHGRLGAGSAPAPPTSGQEHAATRHPEEDAARDEGRPRGAGHAEGGPDDAGQKRWPLAPRGHDEGGGGAVRRASPAAPRDGDEGRAEQAPRQGTAAGAPDRGGQGARPEGAAPTSAPDHGGQGARPEGAAPTSAPDHGGQGARPEGAAPTSAPDHDTQGPRPGQRRGTGPRRDAGAPSGHQGGDDRLFGERAGEYQRRFTSLKGEFVDDPRRAVREVDGLIGEMLEEITRRFGGQRARLSEPLSDEHAGTEELRHAFGGYSAFLDRLLSL